LRFAVSVLPGRPQVWASINERVQAYPSPTGITCMLRIFAILFIFMYMVGREEMIRLVQ